MTRSHNKHSVHILYYHTWYHYGCGAEMHKSWRTVAGAGFFHINRYIQVRQGSSRSSRIVILLQRSVQFPLHPFLYLISLFLAFHFLNYLHTHQNIKQFYCRPKSATYSYLSLLCCGHDPGHVCCLTVSKCCKMCHKMLQKFSLDIFSCE